MAAGISPIPDIAALTMRAGVDPCHVGGTDIAPTNRALPKPPPTPPKPPSPPPPSPLGVVSPTNFGESAPVKAAALAPASPEELPACIPAWTAIIIGDIARLAGCMTVPMSGPYCPYNDWNPDRAPEAALDTGDNTGDTADVNAVPPDPPSPVTCDTTPLSGVDPNNPVRPGRLNDGKLNEGNAAATAAAPP